MNALSLLVFSLLTGVSTAGSAWLLDRVAIGRHLPSRWLWLAALLITVSFPLTALVAPVPRENGAGAPVTVEAPIAAAGAIESEPSGIGADSMDRFFGWWSAPEVVEAGAQALSIDHVDRRSLGVAWGSLTMLVALVVGSSLYALRRRRKEWPTATLHGRDVVLSPATGPATIGIRVPQIVLPRWAAELPAEELEMILRHEEEHVRSGDTLLLGLGLLAVIACPWHPVVWWEMRRLKDAVEVDCDRRVLAAGTRAAPYGKLLVTIVGRPRLQTLLAATLASSPSLLERRLTLMTRMNRRIPFAQVAGLSLAAVALIVVACSSEAPVATEQGTAPAAEAEASPSTAPEETVADATVSIDSDGTTRLNGAAVAIERFGEAVQDAVAEGGIVAVHAHQEAPYAAIAAVQEALSRANRLRVAFSVERSSADRISARDGSPVPDRVLPMVLPDANMPQISESSLSERGLRNLLRLHVLTTGAVEVSRGSSPQRQRIHRDQVEGVVSQALAANASLIVFMRPEADVDYGYVYDVLGAVQRSGATRFGLRLAD